MRFPFFALVRSSCGNYRNHRSSTPSAIRRVVQSGDPCFFTKRFFEDMLARLTGPGRIRLQPTILVRVRDGKRDSQAKSTPFLLLAFRRAHRPKRFRYALTSVRDLVGIAIILDMIAQAIILREVHPASALLLGPVLIAVPYSISRTLANRFFHLASSGDGS